MVIELGYYPQNVKFTQKKKNIQYQIPDSYIIKTEVANHMLRCETKYTLTNTVLYTITWKEGRAEWIVSSEKSASGAVSAFLKVIVNYVIIVISSFKLCVSMYFLFIINIYIIQKINREKSRLSGIHVFGFDIDVLHQIRIGQPSPINKVIIDKRKRPLNEIQSLSQQNKRYASFGRDAYKNINDLILQHQMVSESGNPICIRNMELEDRNNIINIKYNLALNITRLDAYVRACDEALLGRDGYRRLAAVEAQLIREYQVAQRRIEITKLINGQIPIGTINLDKELNQQPILDDDEHQSNPDGIIVDEQEIGNGVYRSIRNLLQIFIPIWNRSNPPILQSGNTINLKLGEDGRNVGRKQNHVMMTICLLNEKMTC